MLNNLNMQCRLQECINCNGVHFVDVVFRKHSLFTLPIRAILVNYFSRQTLQFNHVTPSYPVATVRSSVDKAALRIVSCKLQECIPKKSSHLNYWITVVVNYIRTKLLSNAKIYEKYSR